MSTGTEKRVRVCINGGLFQRAKQTWGKESSNKHQLPVKKKGSFWDELVEYFLTVEESSLSCQHVFLDGSKTLQKGYQDSLKELQQRQEIQLNDLVVKQGVWKLKMEELRGQIQSMEEKHQAKYEKELGTRLEGDQELLIQLLKEAKDAYDVADSGYDKNGKPRILSMFSHFPQRTLVDLFKCSAGTVSKAIQFKKTVGPLGINKDQPEPITSNIFLHPFDMLRTEKVGSQIFSVGQQYAGGKAASL